jgi:HAD superfamily hydrolase (TIGR01490 family)
LSAAGSTATPPRLALFDLDGTLLAGDTDALWCDFLIGEGVLERGAFEAGNRAIAERYARGAITPAEFCAFYAATLAGRSAAEWAPLRQRFVAAVIAPRLGAQSLALVEQHRVAGDRLVLTTATSRFLTEPIAEQLGIADLVASELEVVAGRFTGRNAGVVNMRDGKVTRLKAWLAGQASATTVWRARRSTATRSRLAAGFARSVSRSRSIRIRFSRPRQRCARGRSCASTGACAATERSVSQARERAAMRRSRSAGPRPRAPRAPAPAGRADGCR